MEVLEPGSAAPPVPGVDFATGPTALFFYKVTCPVCQMSAAPTHRFEDAYPGRIVGIGQDPPEKLEAFDRTYGLGVPSLSDPQPYPLSDAYGVQVVPTLFLVDREGTILETVESWDRDGFNAVSRRLAELLDAEYAPISEAADGLPAFRPG